MAIVVQDSDRNHGTATSLTTASITSLVNRTIVIAIATNGDISAATPSGLGITWTRQVNVSQNGTAFLVIWTGISVGNTGTITVTWGVSRPFCYQVARLNNVTGGFIRAATTGATAAASPNALTPSIASWPTNQPGFQSLLFGVWVTKTANTVVPTFAADTGEATWTAGTTQTEGTTPPLSLNAAWTTAGGDSAPTGTWTFASGTADTLVGVLLYSEGAPLVQALPVQVPVATLYTIGAGGFQPSRMIRAGSFDMLAGAGIPGLSAGPALGQGVGRDDTIGSPNPPSFRLTGNQVLGPFDWPVEAGQRTIKARCYYTPDDGALARPRLIVRASSDLGVQIDYISPAIAGADVFVDFPVVTINVARRGVLAVLFDYHTGRIDGIGTPGSPRCFANIDRIRVT